MNLTKLNYFGRKTGQLSISIRRFSFTIILFLFSLSFLPTAKAESLNIVSDIKPVHSLVSMVLGDLGTSALIASRNVSPHDYIIRPSEAKMISEADIIFWSGPAVIPSLEKFFDELPPGTIAISLLEEVEDSLLPIRDPGSLFEDDHEGEDDHGDEDENEEEGHHEEEDDHGDEADAREEDHEGEDDHGDEDENEEEGHHEEEDDHGDEADAREEDHEGEDDHGDEAKSGGHGHGHDEGGLDPHAWLDPYIALQWIDIIADILMSEDPTNQQIYLSNAEQAKAKILELDHDIKDRLHDLNPRFMVYHDAFQYFELRYGLNAIGMISDVSGSDPGARHIRRLIDEISDEGVTCAFSEPLFEDDLLETVVSVADIKVYEIDPTGARLELGADLYLDLISNIADSFIECGSSD